MFLQTLAF